MSYSAGLLNVGTLNVPGANGTITASVINVPNGTVTTKNLNNSNLAIVGNNLTVGGALSASGAAHVGGAFDVSGNSTFAGQIKSSEQILSSGPIRDGCYDFLPTTRAQVQAFADGIIAGNSTSIPNLFVGYGNAKDSSLNIVVSGKQSDGSGVPVDPYIRLTSLTKPLGAVIAGKMIGDGWVNLDTPLASFLGNGWFDSSNVARGDMIPDSSGIILFDTSSNGQKFYKKPWLSANRTIMDSSGVIRTMQAAYTTWAASQSPPFVSTATLNRCPDINVGHCLNHTCGLPYDHQTVGRFSDLFESCGDFATLNRVKQFGGSDYLTVYGNGQVGSSYADPSGNYSASLPPRLLVDASGNATYTSDDYLSLISSQPVSSLPGLFSEYGQGYDVLGLFIDQVIKQTPALSALYTDIIDYAQKAILIPIGITDSWVMGGQSAAPADCKTRMLSASIQRSSTSELGGKSKPYGVVDTSQNGLKSILGVDITKYAYTDASGFTFTGYFNSSNVSQTVWADHVPGDSNTINYNNLHYQTTKNTNLKHVGFLGSSWCMSVSSFCKLLRFVANKGYDVVSKRRIMPKAVFTFIDQSAVTESAWTGVTDYEHFNSVAPSELSYAYGAPLVWGFGGYKFVELSSLEYKGLSFTINNGTSLNGIVVSNFINQPPLYPFAPGAHIWAGIMNMGWYMDPESGNFVVFGHQQGQWAGPAPGLFQPRRSSIRAVPPGPAPVRSPQNTNYAFSRLIQILMDSDTD